MVDVGCWSLVAGYYWPLVGWLLMQADRAAVFKSGSGRIETKEFVGVTGLEDDCRQRPVTGLGNVKDEFHRQL